MSNNKPNFFSSKTGDIPNLLSSILNLTLGGSTGNHSSGISGYKDEFLRPFSLDSHMLCDCYESNDLYIVLAYLPGIDKANIKVSIKTSEKILTISAVRKRETVVDEKINFVEIFQGEMLRKIQLPMTVDVDNITSQHELGVLKLVFKKIEPEQPREITL